MKELPTPCHIIHLDLLQENLDRISYLKERSGCRILLAIKGFSAPYLFGQMNHILDGVSASGLYEARLGREYFGGHIQTYSPAFSPEQVEDILYYSDTIVFNSGNQLLQYASLAKQQGLSCGIRINPLVSEVHKQDADPCQPYSCLGIPITDFSPELLELVDGIHIHAMCEQHVDSLERLVDFLSNNLSEALHKIKWINLGGGQLIGHPDYDNKRAVECIRQFQDTFDLQVILEPCEGVLTQCGYFAAKILDIVQNGIANAILDASPVCHMQDAVFRGWQRNIIGEALEPHGFRYRLSGPTCFAGDTFGIYTFSKPLQVGDTLYFQDTATYTWVKNNAFNGIPFPSICTYSKDLGIQVVKQYDYQSFLSIL